MLEMSGTSKLDMTIKEGIIIIAGIFCFVAIVSVIAFICYEYLVYDKTKKKYLEVPEENEEAIKKLDARYKRVRIVLFVILFVTLFLCSLAYLASKFWMIC